MEVALSILELLDLVVGSGAGKFCLVGALNSKAHFFGVEQRQSLVKMANQLAEYFRITNSSFIHADALKIDWSEYEVIYLFNSYYENIMAAGLRIDLDIKVSHKKYKDYILASMNKLSQLKVGTKIVTYYGFGQGLPDNYKLTTSIAVGLSQIDLWTKISF